MSTILLLLFMTFQYTISIAVTRFNMFESGVTKYEELTSKSKLYNVKSKLHCSALCASLKTINPTQKQTMYFLFQPDIHSPQCAYHEGICYFVKKVTSCVEYRSNDVPVCKCKQPYYGQFCHLVFTSCNDVANSVIGSVNGVYLLRIAYGGEIEVFCDFQPTKIITFISKYSLSRLSSSDLRFFHNKTHVIMRQDMATEQKDAVLTQLKQFENTDLTISVNQPWDFRPPINSILGQYLYLGFLSSSTIIESGRKNGYGANGNEYSFTNCNSHYNSYFIFFPNLDNKEPTDRRNHSTSMVFGWFTNSQSIATTQYLPEEYFYATEIHFGGCGGFTVSSEWTTVRGAALGLV